MSDHKVRNGGDWLFTDDDGDSVVAMLTDIEQFARATIAAKRATSMKSMRAAIESAFDYVQFAPVTIGKKGIVKWESGKFVDERDEYDASSDYDND